MCGILGCFYTRKLNQSDIDLMRKIRKKLNIEDLMTKENG